MTFVSNIMNLKAYYILDELIVAGELQESSTRTVLQQIVAHVFLLMVFLFFFSHYISTSSIWFVLLKFHAGCNGCSCQGRGQYAKQYNFTSHAILVYQNHANFKTSSRWNDFRFPSIYKYRSTIFWHCNFYPQSLLFIIKNSQLFTSNYF